MRIVLSGAPRTGIDCHLVGPLVLDDILCTHAVVVVDVVVYLYLVPLSFVCV